MGLFSPKRPNFPITNQENALNSIWMILISMLLPQEPLGVLTHLKYYKSKLFLPLGTRHLPPQDSLPDCTIDRYKICRGSEDL